MAAGRQAKKYNKKYGSNAGLRATPAGPYDAASFDAAVPVQDPSPAVVSEAGAWQADLILPVPPPAGLPRMSLAIRRCGFHTHHGCTCHHRRH
eukprot:137573-Chlamydomonas_euryale.AAC.2